MKKTGKGVSRRQVLKAGAAGLVAGLTAQRAGLAAAVDLSSDPDVILTNGKIYTMDSPFENQATFATSASIRAGRWVQVGNVTQAPGPNTQVIDLKGKTVIPGIIDGHNHIVLVGNRPGYHVLMEDLNSVQAVIDRYVEKFNALGMTADDFRTNPNYGVMTTIGPITGQQMTSGTAANPAGNRLPTVAELNAALPGVPIFIQAAQGGSVNAAANWFADHPGTGTLLVLRRDLNNPEQRKRSAMEALRFYTELGTVMHGDKGAFLSDTPNNGIANENYYTMYYPFLELWREGRMPARLRFDYLHQDAPTDANMTTLGARLRNAWQFHGDGMLKSSSIGEFTSTNGLVVNNLRAIARAGWSGEDHIVGGSPSNLIAAREAVQTGDASNPGIDMRGLRFILAHIPQMNPTDAARWNALGGGVWVGWGPTRSGVNVGPPYKQLFGNTGTDVIHMGWHSDGGDITCISPWLNLYTTISGKNLLGSLILGDQELTRHQAIWIATASQKWFFREEDMGTIEPGNHADIAVLDRNIFDPNDCPELQIKEVKSVLTMVAGKVVFDRGVL
jgi:predicted amidohydrolase YtcJ